ncbi:MAG TPA: hypothetical protein DGK99_07655, partial [Acidimicrobiaceae bacterium]|nr:hypothetical protein [Acidimicrobiaceae bacterium]
MTVTFTPPQFSTARRAPARAEVVAHGITIERLADGDPLPSGLDRADLGRLGFEAKAGQVQVVPSDGRLVAAVGLGVTDELGTNGLRRAAAALGRAARTRRSLATDLASVVATTGELTEADGVAAVVEGLTLALYRFGYRSADDKGPVSDRLARVSLVGSTAAGVKTSIEQAEAVVG